MRRRPVREVVRIFSWALIVSLVMMSIASQGRTQPLTRVNVGHSMISPEAMAVWVAKDRDFFQKYGLDAQLIQIIGDSPMGQAMMAGEIQIAISGGASTIRSAARGGDLMIVAGLVNHLNFKLWTRAGSPITRVQDLKGKAIGVSAQGDLPSLVGRLILEEHRMSARDVTFRALGAGPARLAGLERGVVDAGVFGPFAAGMTERLKLVFDASDLKVPLPAIPVISTRRVIRSNPEVVENALKALAEAVAFINTPANKRVVINTLRVRLNLKSPEQEEPFYAETLRTLKDPTLALSVKGLQAFIRILAEEDSAIAKVKMEEVMDLRFLKKLEESGFIKDLYRK
ncbi:MAG: ABC transporter substrate-binding protein [Deltaproteobacteria bacterium]|nr:ABC transporter substrate-binding protein [Deltaproteobacteria bacterium]